MKAILPASLFLAGLLSASLGAAQSRESRREFDALLRSAVQHYEAGQAREAISELERAYAIRPLPRLLYNLGRAHERAGSFAVAADYYNRFLLTSPDAEAGAIAREAMATAQRRAAEVQQAEQARQVEAEAAQRQAIEAARAQAAEAERQRANDERRRQLTLTASRRRLTTPVLVTGGVAAAAARRTCEFAIGSGGTSDVTRPVEVSAPAGLFGTASPAVMSRSASASARPRSARSTAPV